MTVASDWDALFDEFYLKTYAPLQADQDPAPLALGAVRLAGCPARDGGRQSTTYDFRIYTATELVALAQSAGFEAVECYGDVDRTPLSAETRLLLAGEAPS